MSKFRIEHEFKSNVIEINTNEMTLYELTQILRLGNKWVI